MEPTERIIRLEERAHHERERTDFHLGALDRRVSRLEEATSRASEMVGGHGLKLLLAAGLTLLAILLTGDPRAAVTAARMGLGLP